MSGSQNLHISEGTSWRACGTNQELEVEDVSPGSSSTSRKPRSVPSAWGSGKENPLAKRAALASWSNWRRHWAKSATASLSVNRNYSKWRKPKKKSRFSLFTGTTVTQQSFTNPDKIGGFWKNVVRVSDKIGPKARCGLSFCPDRFWSYRYLIRVVRTAFS